MGYRRDFLAPGGGLIRPSRGTGVEVRFHPVEGPFHTCPPGLPSPVAPAGKTPSRRLARAPG